MSADLESKWVASKGMQTLLFWPSSVNLIAREEGKWTILCSWKACFISLLGDPPVSLGFVLSPMEFESPTFLDFQTNSDMTRRRKLAQQDDVARNVCDMLKVAILLFCHSSDAPRHFTEFSKRARKTLLNPTFYCKGTSQQKTSYLIVGKEGLVMLILSIKNERKQSREKSISNTTFTLSKQF